MRDLTAQILGLTGDEPPLTPDDIRRAVRFALSGWYGEWLLAGGDRAHQIRSRDGGSAGWIDEHTSVNVTYRRSGLLIRVSEHPGGRAAAMRPGPPPPPTAVRFGCVTWRQAEDVLRAAQQDDGALFNLETL